MNSNFEIIKKEFKDKITSHSICIEYIPGQTWKQLLSCHLFTYWGQCVPVFLERHFVQRRSYCYQNGSPTNLQNAAFSEVLHIHHPGKHAWPMLMCQEAYSAFKLKRLQKHKPLQSLQTQTVLFLHEMLEGWPASSSSQRNYHKLTILCSLNDLWKAKSELWEAEGVGHILYWVPINFRDLIWNFFVAVWLVKYSLNSRKTNF